MEMVFDRSAVARLAQLDRPAPKNDILLEMREAVERHVRSLCYGDFRGMPQIMKGEVARDMLRIEVGDEAYCAMQEALYPEGSRAPLEDRAKEEKFLGVSIYEVRHDLPAPGWRVVNPFHRKVR